MLKTFIIHFLIITSIALNFFNYLYANQPDSTVNLQFIENKSDDVEYQITHFRPVPQQFVEKISKLLFFNEFVLFLSYPSSAYLFNSDLVFTKDNNQTIYFRYGIEGNNLNIGKVIKLASGYLYHGQLKEHDSTTYALFFDGLNEEEIKIIIDKINNNFPDMDQEDTKEQIDPINNNQKETVQSFFSEIFTWTSYASDIDEDDLDLESTDSPRLIDRLNKKRKGYCRNREKNKVESHCLRPKIRSSMFKRFRTGFKNIVCKIAQNKKVRNVFNHAYSCLGRILQNVIKRAVTDLLFMGASQLASSNQVISGLKEGYEKSGFIKDVGGVLKAQFGEKLKGKMASDVDQLSNDYYKDQIEAEEKLKKVSETKSNKKIEDIVGYVDGLIPQDAKDKMNKYSIPQTGQKAYDLTKDKAQKGLAYAAKKIKIFKGPYKAKSIWGKAKEFMGRFKSFMKETLGPITSLAKTFVGLPPKVITEFVCAFVSDLSIDIALTVFDPSYAAVLVPKALSRIYNFTRFLKGYKKFEIMMKDPPPGIAMPFNPHGEGMRGKVHRHFLANIMTGIADNSVPNFFMKDFTQAIKYNDPVMANNYLLCLGGSFSNIVQVDKGSFFRKIQHKAVKFYRKHFYSSERLEETKQAESKCDDIKLAYQKSKEAQKEKEDKKDKTGPKISTEEQEDLLAIEKTQSDLEKYKPSDDISSRDRERSVRQLIQKQKGEAYSDHNSSLNTIVSNANLQNLRAGTQSILQDDMALRIIKKNTNRPSAPNVQANEKQLQHARELLIDRLVKLTQKRGKIKKISEDEDLLMNMRQQARQQLISFDSELEKIAKRIEQINIVLSSDDKEQLQLNDAYSEISYNKKAKSSLVAGLIDDNQDLLHLVSKNKATTQVQNSANQWIDQTYIDTHSTVDNISFIQRMHQKLEQLYFVTPEQISKVERRETTMDSGPLKADERIGKWERRIYPFQNYYPTQLFLHAR